MVVILLYANLFVKEKALDLSAKAFLYKNIMKLIWKYIDGFDIICIILVKKKTLKDNTLLSNVINFLRIVQH